jgi:hypothetical protein
MAETLLSFQKFNDPILAQTIADHLQKDGIPCTITDEAGLKTPYISFNQYESTIHLRIPAADFPKARASFEAYYAAQLDSIDPDYYLFSFTNEELQDIIHHPDEWGPLDYALAKKLLAQHGQTISVEQEADIRQQRLTTLAAPEKNHMQYIVLGYIFAICGGLFGLFFGYALASTKKNLPNGQQVYMFNESERKHGKRILVIAIVGLTIFIWRYFIR